MKPALLASLITAGLLVVSLAGVAVYVTQTEDAPIVEAADHTHAEGPGADLAAIQEGMAGDGHHNGAAGMERPTFPEAVGRTPTAADAESLERVHHLEIQADSYFAPANGVRSGSGTPEDPYIISGYFVEGDLFIANTDACFIVKENYVAGQLTLNWNGQCAHVHHNFIGDLRVNENNRRTGFATGGLLELNKIRYIGQLRHYDGEFRNNEVGPFTQEDIFDPVRETVPWMFGTDPRVANIDGFNQGLIHHNTFHGSVDLDLHGHHHGTGFFAPHSHYHGENETKKMPHDHTDRWTSVAFTDNLIIDPEGYGLRYEDRNHAGDDRTANSEDEETLNDDHMHHTHIVMNRNTIEGAQLWVDVFNADDDLHYTRNPGWLEIRDNTINFVEKSPEHFLGLFYFGEGTDWNTAMHITTAKEVELSVTGNKMTYTAAPKDEDPLNPDLFGVLRGEDESMNPIGIRLDRIRDANLVLAGNTFEGFYYGIFAEQFDEAVSWSVDDNDFTDAQYEVYYDESVPNQPSGNNA